MCGCMHTPLCVWGGGAGQSMYCTPGLQGRENGMKTVWLPQPSSFHGTDYLEHFV